MGVEGTGYGGAGARKNKKWERYGRSGGNGRNWDGGNQGSNAKRFFFHLLSDKILSET